MEAERWNLLNPDEKRKIIRPKMFWKRETGLLLLLLTIRGHFPIRFDLIRRNLFILLGPMATEEVIQEKI